MRRCLFLTIPLIFSASILIAQAQEAPASVDVYSGGERYPSFEAYHRAETRANQEESKGSLSVQGTAFENSPINVDLSKARTLTINADGTIKEQIGPEGLKEDIQERPIVSSEGEGQKTLPEAMEGELGMTNLGRVAGVEPTFEDILKELHQESVPPQQVSSPEDIQKDLEARLGDEEPLVLIVSDHKKARVMELKEDPKQAGVLQATDGLPQKP